MKARWLGCLLWAAALAGAQGATDTPPIVTSAAGLEQRLAQAQALWLRVPAGSLSAPQADALRAWVAAGGILWTDGDVVGLFGFEYVAATAAETIGHGRLACAVGSTPLTTGVNDVFYRLGEGAVLLTGHPAALPLLRVVDPPLPYNAPRFPAAALWYGRGQVVHRPAEIHLGRLEGARFDANLKRGAVPADDEVALPVETLAIAQDRAVQAAGLAKKKPAEAKPILYQIFLAYRLWYAEHLTATQKLDEALAQLSAVAADLPDDPAVYLAVARLNDALGRAAEAAAARDKAFARYKELKRDPPRLDARQVRVPWAVFVECINAAGKAFENPTRETADLVAARTGYLLGLDAYRRNDLDGAEELWQDAADRAPAWPLPRFQIGLSGFSRGMDIHQPNRRRLAALNRSLQAFQFCATAAASTEFPQPAARNAADWAQVATALGRKLAIEPPDAELRGHFILRYDAADRRLQMGPLFEQIFRAFETAWQLTTQWGIYLDDTEVLVYPDTATMRSAMVGALPQQQAFASAATSGRRIYTAARATDASRIARHEFTHVVSNALTEGGVAPPLWFEEGLATVMEDDQTRMQLANVALHRGEALNMTQLNDPTIFYQLNVADISYGESALLVRAMVQQFGVGVIVRYLQACGWGQPQAAALQALTGLTPDQLLAAYVQGRLGR